MAFNTVQQIFDIIDDLINMMVDTNVTTIIATVTPTVAIFLTIKFMAQGAYSALSPGGGGEALGDLITQYMKAAVVLSFATAGGLYQTDLVHLALTLPDNFASILVTQNKTSSTGMAAIIDTGVDQSITAIQTAFEGAGISANGIMSAVIGLILIAATVVLCGLGSAFVIMAKVLLAISLCLGPIAIFCLLWNPTKGIFAKWMGTVINYSLVIALLALVFGLLMSLFTKMISGLNGSEGFDALSTAIGLVILTIVSVYVLFQVPAVASNFGSGVSADIASAARHAGHSMNTMGNVASNGIFGGAKPSARPSAAGGGGGQSASSSGNAGAGGSGLTGKARGSRGKAA
ncbi:type IV secretion system protein [Klebsiella pneumoniae]|uniref:type IV secretion system protein n=1 Tax=Klebsiella grimontii TaxID=2058152 RepID=UPI00180E7B90|nr:type IV secretion system protein [Klebsiella grimontii]ECQ1243058.1 type IV secretion system protein [Salmonella enterica subsp. enterica serovar Kedougou]EDX8187747.1 type IV secretion system protein [Salmonella enterica subsp. enterica]EJN1228006.1 type IV secretion system protein [Salmonella enterica subsp. enterica serovar Schwarzengrund]HAF4515611.1 type IV secretion system protein [Salmonella enterica]HAH2494247.1 conjugal transfer protein TraD [Escherichia coli]